MKEFFSKYRTFLLLITIFIIVQVGSALILYSCNKTKTIQTVPGYDSTYHKFADSLSTAIQKHSDSVDNAYAKKLELYDSTVMNSDIRMEVRRQVYSELKKFRKQQSGQELDDELRRRINK